VKGPSGVGKNFLTDTVLGFFPTSDVEALTSASTRSWNYLGKKLRHKVVYVKERNDEAGSVHPTRLLISEKELVHNVTVKKGGRFVHERKVAKGPIASISTTTKDRVEVDDETRHISIRLDESAQQTRRILEAVVSEQKSPTPTEKRSWLQVQNIIKARASLPIELPKWFVEVVPHVCSDSLWARRYFSAFLQACKTVALIRSFNRKAQKPEKPKRIVVRFSDFAVTALILNPVFERSLDRADDEDVEVQDHVGQICAREEGGASAKDLTVEMGISLERAYAAIRKALDAGTIRRVNEPSKTNFKLYAPAEPHRFLPDPGEVFQKLEGMPEQVRFVHPLTGKWVTYSRK
jgi:hypothetical protein